MTTFELRNLSARQSKFVRALAAHGVRGPIVSRQNLKMACDASGIYACPPSWITQDSGRAMEQRGTYLLPELVQLIDAEGVPELVRDTEQVLAAPPSTIGLQGGANAPTPAPAAINAPATASANLAASIMGATGGDRATLIPDKIKTYVPWGHFDSIKKIIDSNMFYPVFVTGLSGNGKTTGIEQACAAAGRECFRVNITKATDEDDLLGGFRLIDGETKFVYGPVVEAMKRGAVLLLDEIDLAGLGIMCLQSVLEGKGVFLKKTNEWITPAAGFTVFATANTKGKGSDDGRFIGTGAMNEAFLDRFPVTLEQEYAPRSTEKKIVRKAMKSLGCDDESFAINLTKWADTIRKSFYEGAVDEIITTRRLIDIVKANAIFGDKMTAINMAVSRFDDETKEGFISLYTKIDAEVVMADESETQAEGGVSSDCPFE
ncbi:MAG: AAA family ATPase [Candidatus Thermoplasmatota archaeon]|nr:AAA family ATPase [Candidatus Thermoplasmatota archaeon]